MPVPAIDIKHMALACAQNLRRKGLKDNSLVALPMEASAPLVAIMLGTWLAGGHFVLLPAKETGAQATSKPLINPAVLDLLQPWAIVHDGLVGDLLTENRAAHWISAQELLQGHADSSIAGNDVKLPAASDLALLQMTSGSTSAPKAIPITHAMLDANCAGIVNRCAITQRDHMVSWLPMNHDMGLSALTVALFSEAHLTLIPVSEFTRNPLVWLDVISKQKGTVSPAPTFAYGLMPRLRRRIERMAVDLSTWRYGWVGAEPVFVHVLETFEACMSAFGLKSGVLKPSYGMAEAVVAISCSDPFEPYRKLTICRTTLFEKSQAVKTNEFNPNSITLASNGKPLENVSLRVINDQNQILPDGHVGEVCVSGPFITDKYLDNIDHDRFGSHGFLTGDLGFLLDGHVYITGRKKDLIVRGGVNVAAHNIELAAETVLNLRGGTCAAFSDIDFQSGHERVVLIIGCLLKIDEEETTRAEIARQVLNETGLQIDSIVFVPASSVPKTTSGKVQRGVARMLWREGKFSNSPKLKGSDQNG